MLNKKVLSVILLLVMLTATLGLVAFSYAWYVVEKSERMEFYLQADGFLIIYFSEDVDYSDTIITPALAMPYAVRDNLNMDVLRVYNELDPEPSYIQTAATVGTYDAVINYHNAEQIPIENNISIQIEAWVTLSETARVPINLEREINISISVNVIDSQGEEENYTIDNLAPGQVFTVPPLSVIEVTLNAYIKLPDDLCAPALNEGPLSFIVRVESTTFQP